MSTGTLYTARTVVEHGYSQQVSLPSAVLDRADVSRGDTIPATYDDDNGQLRLFDTDGGMKLRVVRVGSSLGVTIPAGVRHRNDICPGDVVFAAVDNGVIDLIL